MIVFCYLSVILFIYNIITDEKANNVTKPQHILVDVPQKSSISSGGSQSAPSSFFPPLPLTVILSLQYHRHQPLFVFFPYGPRFTAVSL